MFLEVEMQESILIPPDQLVRRSSQGRNPSLNGRFCHQKVGSSLIKIGKGRIRDLTGDILFPVIFKAAIPTTIPTVTMKNPRYYWCIISNKALTDISNRVDPPFPWTGALTPRVLANRTSWPVKMFSHEPGKDAKD